MSIPIPDPILSSIQQAKSLMAGYFGLNMLQSMLAGAGKSFFEDDLPVKATYVDPWPATCAKIRELGSSFWSRRIEGAAAAGLASSSLFTVYFLSDQNSFCNFLWDRVTRITEPFVMQSSTPGQDEAIKNATALIFFPALLGVATTLYLGSRDLVRKYYSHDNLLETKPIFHQELQKEIDAIVTCNRGLKHSKGFFQNLLLYGPPGTGKTMVAKWIAKNLKMNCFLMSGGDLHKYPTTSSRVAALQTLIDRAKRLESPTVIFIDEAESITQDREGKSDPALLKFLEETGQASSKVMFILATNRPWAMDPAALNRMNFKLFIDVPKIEERKKIIKANADILFGEESKVFTNAIVTRIAEQTERFAGRDIFNLVNRMKGQATVGKKINIQNVDATIQSWKKQEETLEAFKKGQKNPAPAGGLMSFLRA